MLLVPHPPTRSCSSADYSDNSRTTIDTGPDMRGSRDSTVARGFPSGQGVESWTNAQAAGGLIDLWEACPALARQVGIAVNNWVDRTEELLTRAAADIDAINDYFGTHVTRLERAVTGLSDPHRGHATVVDCTFVDATGVPTHLIYKPRDISTEVSFAAVCEDLAEHGIDSGAALRMLPRGSYRWVEKVEPRPTVSTEDADIYFRRAGALVALLFALGATDIHGENVVAHGSRPVVIDAETIMQPSMRAGGNRADDPSSRRTRHHERPAVTAVAPVGVARRPADRRLGVRCA